MLKFGEKFAKVWPEEKSYILNEFGKKLLGECAKIEKKRFADTTIAAIINASSQFPIEFGTNTCRIQNQPEGRHNFIQNQLASAYPVIHERVLHLFLQFLEHKCQYVTIVIQWTVLLVDNVNKLVQRMNHVKNERKENIVKEVMK